ncbi:hypothetical protein [Rhodopseudomonas sp. BR0M22]|uniref:hypothetical protein n=1 Tax=Rhodopseudomonas sp. BR0M22 TaxID=2269369 RepID=UPI0013DF6CE9|nr:hypothetical protein [Rhodopseudomonas sp. BR0M22]NEW92044.1 hypothetical protein [Rhodopseudomonas sp. BR0M22]
METFRSVLCSWPSRKSVYFKYAFALFVAQIGSGFAHAEIVGDPGDDWRLNLNAQFSAPGPHQSRQDHHLYRIDFKCKATAALPMKKVVDLLVMRSVTTSHSVIISKDYVAPDASGKLKIPEKPLSLLTPYAVNAQNISDNRAICPKVPIIVSGTQPIYIVAMVNYSTTNAPGAIIKIGYSIAKLIPALWSVFEPAAMPASIGNKLSGVGDTKGPMEDILSTFNDDKSFGKGFDLDVGRYLVKTDYNEIEVTVAKLDSVVLAKPSSLQETFRTQIRAAPDQIKPDSVGSTCANVAGALKDAGFSEGEDIPYALVNLASRLGSKPKLIECLEATGTTDTALKLGPVLWKWIIKKLVITDDDLANIQPSSFADAKRRIYNFIVALSRITKGDTARAAEGVAQLKMITTEKVNLVDTIDDLLGGSGSLQPNELAQRLVSKGYLRFGCMAPVGDKNGAGMSNGVGSFLMIRASADVNSAKLADALPVHVVFKRGLISSILAFQEPGWVKTNLDANEGNCNGFRVIDGAVAESSGGRLLATQ